MFLKFYSLLNYLKNYYCELPRNLQIELVDVLQEYKDLVRINRLIKEERSKEVEIPNFLHK